MLRLMMVMMTTMMMMIMTKMTRMIPKTINGYGNCSANDDDEDASAVSTLVEGMTFRQQCRLRSFTKGTCEHVSCMTVVACQLSFNIHKADWELTIHAFQMAESTLYIYQYRHQLQRILQSLWLLQKNFYLHCNNSHTNI